MHGEVHGRDRLPASSRQRLRRFGTAMVVAGCLVWAFLHRPMLSELTAESELLLGLGIVLALSHVAYFGGLALAAAALARAAGDRGGARAWRRHASMRRWSTDLLLVARDDPWFWRGFRLNFAAAVVAALVPAVAIVWTLPPGTWSLLVISALDLLGAVVLRVAVVRMLRRLESVPTLASD